VAYYLLSYAAMGLRAAEQITSPCIGREAELDTILRLVEENVSKSGGFIALTGPPGVGKSTLLTEAGKRLSRAGLTVLAAKCSPGLPSYQPISQILNALLSNIRSPITTRQQRDTAEQILETITGGRDDANNRPDQGRRIAFFDQLADLLRQCSNERPLALLIHDIDRADHATQNIVSYLARVLTCNDELSTGNELHGAIVATAGSVASLARDRQWTTGVAFSQVELGKMNVEAIRAYLSSDAVVQEVMRATAGMPHALHNLFNDQITEGAKTRALPADQGELLDLLATIGQPTSADRLLSLSDLKADGLHQAATALIRRRLLTKSVVEGELRLAFARAGSQHAHYQGIDGQRRQELHARIGEFYLELADERNLELCAEHLLRGKSATRAVTVALRAGERLAAAFCFERAAELWQEALPLADRSSQALLHEKLCQIYETLGNTEKSLEHAEALLSDTDVTDQTRISLEHQVAHCRLGHGDYSGAIDGLSSLNERCDNPELTGRILADLAEAHHLAGDSDSAIATITSARGFLDVIGSEETSAQLQIQLQNTLGNIELERGNSSTASKLFELNCNLARENGLPDEEIRSLTQLGLASLHENSLAEAERFERQALAKAETTLGRHRRAGICLQHLAVITERRSNFAEALALYQRAVGTFKKTGHRTHLAWTAIDLGKLYLELGEVNRARAMVRLAERLGGTDAAAALTINCDILHGRLAMQDSRFAEARERLRRSANEAKTVRQQERQSRALWHLAQLELELGDAQAAQQTLNEIPAPLPNSLRAGILLTQANVLRDAGHGDKARQRYGELLEFSDATESREHQWQALYQLSQLAKAKGRHTESKRLLADAAVHEDHVRGKVPASFLESFVQQPVRAEFLRELEKEDVGIVRHEDSPAPSAQETTEEGPIVGVHPRMKQIMAQVAKVAPTDSLVLIRGESGTGKELIADAVHGQSTRRTQSMVKVNCGALVESLLLSELFGHEKGAFTGASQRRVGRFELAEGGTIFLDEIGDISAKTQVALLRVLQERTIERVGGVKSINVDVRIICATHRDLEQMVAAGEFREDLYYRLKGIPIDLPPLRERGEDVLKIASRLLERIAKERCLQPKTLSPAAAEMLCAYRWPGNVRELENVLRSVSLFAEHNEMRREDFADYQEISGSTVELASNSPLSLDDSAYQYVRDGSTLKELKKQIEVACIQRALSESNHNITKAAAMLGMKRPRLSQLVKEYGIDKDA